MSSPGQKRGTCGHVMVSFDGHSKCARCRDKGVGEEDCVLKKDCAVCKGFTPEQVLQQATPTYSKRKNKEKKVVASSPAPTLVDPSHVSVLGKVEGGKAVKPETTPAAKKSKRSESPKTASKKKSSSSSKPSAEDLQKEVLQHIRDFYANLLQSKDDKLSDTNLVDLGLEAGKQDKNDDLGSPLTINELG